MKIVFIAALSLSALTIPAQALNLAEMQKELSGMVCSGNVCSRGNTAKEISYNGRGDWDVHTKEVFFSYRIVKMEKSTPKATSRFNIGGSF